MSTRTSRAAKRVSRSKQAKPTPAAAPAPAKPSYARGNPLTHSVNFTDRAGTWWLAYVEPAAPEPSLWPNAAVIPGRRLRFDSVNSSVMVAPFPAGAPFLQERTLQLLLDQAQSAGSTAAPPAVHREPARRRAPRLVVAEPGPFPDLPAEPVRDQLTSVINTRSGWTYSRLVQPVALLLVVIRDMILPRGRG